MFRTSSLGVCVGFVALAALPACSKNDKSSGRISGDMRDAAPEAGGPVAVPPPEPDDCFTMTDAGVHTRNCEGLEFAISVPDECAAHACGLVTDIHGFGMNADLMDVHTHMRALAGEKGYIVLQPSAPGAVLSSAWSPANDAQVWALMQRVIKVWHVDSKRIHVDGYSMGSWMTWRLVCAHSDVLASAAPIAGGLNAGMGSCPFKDEPSAAGGGVPSTQIPVLYTHGRNDGLVNFSEAMAERDAVVAAWYPGVEPEVVEMAADYEWDRYTNADGNVFEFVQHDWACGFVLPLGANKIALKGHCFPGSNQFLGCGRDTNGNADGGIEYPFKWSETVLDFFERHPKKD